MNVLRILRSERLEGRDLVRLWSGSDYLVADDFLDSAGPITATLTQTLGAATSSATGQVLVSGQASVTLAAATVSAQGGGLPPITGTLAATLSPANTTGAGQVLVQGATSRTLSPATSSGQGQVLAAGTLARTLGAATVSATGTLLVQGSLAKTLSPATSSGQGSVAVSGTASVTLGAATVLAFNQAPISPTASHRCCVVMAQGQALEAKGSDSGTVQEGSRIVQTRGKRRRFAA